MATGPGQTYLGYAWEGTYATAGSPINKIFGQGQEFTPTLSNQTERVFGSEKRNAQVAVAGNVDMASSVTCKLSNAWWLRGVLGSPATTASGAVFTHTYLEADPVQSFTLEQGFDSPGSAARFTYPGTVINSLTLDGTLGAPVEVSMDFVSQQEIPTGTVIAKGARPVELAPSDVLTFAGGSLTVAGSLIARLQSATLTVNPNVDRDYGSEGRVNVGVTGGTREYEVRVSALYEDRTRLHEFVLGQAGSPTLATPDAKVTLNLGYSNNMAGSALKRLTFNLGSAYPDTSSIPSLTTKTIEEVNFIPLYCVNATWEVGGSTGSPAK